MIISSDSVLCLKIVFCHTYYLINSWIYIGLMMLITLKWKTPFNVASSCVHFPAQLPFLIVRYLSKINNDVMPSTAVPHYRITIANHNIAVQVYLDNRFRIFYRKTSRKLERWKIIIRNTAIPKRFTKVNAINMTKPKRFTKVNAIKGKYNIFLLNECNENREWKRDSLKKMRLSDNLEISFKLKIYFLNKYLMLILTVKLKFRMYPNFL